MKLLFIVNATASSVTARTRVVIQKALSAENQVNVAETTRRGHASRLARQAVAEGYDAIIVLGGDGTLNEAANGIAGSTMRMGVLPGGSTNVFARGIGMSNDPINATAELIDAIQNDNVQRIGLGSVDSRYFLFHTGIGFDADVVARVERRGYLKRYAGHPLFVLSTINTAMRGYERKPQMTVHFSDGTTVHDVIQTVVMKLNPFTFLGNRPLNFAPDARLDSKLVCICVQKLEAWRTINFLQRAMLTNRGLRGMHGLQYFSDVDDIVIEGIRPLPYQMDGEYLGESDHLNFKYEPSAISLYVPGRTQRR